ncbi:hypothetical protein, partial [uncultured Brachyspira sp.]
MALNSEDLNKNNLEYDDNSDKISELYNKINNIDEKIDSKIEQNNTNYNSVMLEQNLKNFKEFSDIRKSHKDLENSINEKVSNIVESSISEN